MSTTPTTNSTKTEHEAIVSVALDYFEGWFDGNQARMERALHPALAKRALADDGRNVDHTTALEMVDATARGSGKARDVPDRGIEVKVEDVYGAIANVTVRSAIYREYVQLARTRDGWKIVNVLYART